MRISTWATQFNAKIIRNEERPDNPTGDVIYRIKDIFTTCDGSWSPSNKTGSVEQWATNSYLLPPTDPAYFDDAGGAHHIFARVLDFDGKPIVAQDQLICWSDGVQLLGQENFAQYIKMTITPKARSGWGNQPIWSSFSPERGETGPWAWCPRGAADVMVGGGLPNNLHVSWFVVWQAEARVPAEPDDNHTDTNPAPTVDSLRQVAWEAAGMHSSPTAAFVDYARTHNLGAPLTPENDTAGYRIQGFAAGIVYAPIDQWTETRHVSW